MLIPIHFISYHDTVNKYIAENVLVPIPFYILP